VAQELKRAGWTRARALIGGWEKWQKVGMPVDAKPEVDV
jgi:hypothetical protein